MISLRRLLYFLLFINSFGIFCSANIDEFAEESEKVIVQTTAGLVQGEQVYGEKTWYRFRGIPFAEPPVGNLRFEVLVM